MTFIRSFGTKYQNYTTMKPMRLTILLLAALVCLTGCRKNEDAEFSALQSGGIRTEVSGQIRQTSDFVEKRVSQG